MNKLSEVESLRIYRNGKRTVVPVWKEQEMYSDIILAISALGAGLFGYWRCRTADRNLRHQQYLTGAELLNSQQVDNRGQRYTNRVVGIVYLG